MLLLIDNYDSFTYNLYQSLKVCSATQIDIRVVRNDALSEFDLVHLEPSGLVLSPGPGAPKDSGICRVSLEHFIGKIPILGVCLGYQLIAEVFGATIRKSSSPLHGKTSTIEHSQQGLFQSVRPRGEVARYHSLEVDSGTLSDEFHVDAVTAEARELMAISHKHHELFGLQFHPESFLTQDGDLIIRNFLNRVEG